MNNITEKQNVNKFLDINYLIYYSESLNNEKEVKEYSENKKQVEIKSKNG